MKPLLVRIGSLVSLLLGAGCSSTTPVTAPPEASTFTLTTDKFDVQPGQERYLCYAKTLDEDLSIDRLDYAAPSVVHHLLVARTLTPEPDGMSECDVLFRTSWAPIFSAGKGSATLEAPSGAGYVLPKGTQVLIQLHLLNVTAAPVTEQATVKMRRASTASPSPVSIYAFGTNVVSLPPHQKASIVNDCTTEKDVEVFEWFPHMHRLGASLTLEVGPSESELKEVFRLDPWNFDDQRMEAKPLHIPSGSFTRVTCTYDNPADTTVGFGESSKDEMCYLVTFATGAGGELDGCINQVSTSDAGVPPNPDAGACGAQTPSAIGVGAACTKGGNECASGLTCSLDQSPDPPGFCLKIGGCTTNAECGGGSATCCAPKEAGGLLNICVPEACRPGDCIPK